jgi:uncharacterized protein (DUF1810 family)
MGQTAGADPFNIQRFLDAQNAPFDHKHSYNEESCLELKEGSKRSHWIWFIFPQIEGLGYSATARKFAISSPAEAQAYLDHPILGPRLRRCTELVNLVNDRSIDEIFGYPDNLKFHASMTLFSHVASDNQVFMDALGKYFGGKLHEQTLEHL